MRNLPYFFHYHRGDTREKIIKVAGSLLVATALLIYGFATPAGKAAEENAELLSKLLPEPGYLITSTRETAQPKPAEVLETQQPVPAVPSVEAKSDVLKPESKEEFSQDNDERDRLEQERQAMELKRWKSDRLKEAKNLLKEIDKVRKQFLRLKNSNSEVARLDVVKNNVANFVTTVNSTADSDDLRALLENTDFGEWWDEMNLLRASVEIPRDLNNLRRDQKRAQSVLKQKWVCKLVDCNKFTPIIQNMNTQLDEITRLYQAGEYEDARATLQESFHEKGWFGDAMGALQMMRGFTEPLRSVRDQSLKEEFTGMLDTVKSLLYEGETRQARETMEAIQRELGPAVWKVIDNAQKRKQDIPQNIREKIELLQQKFGVEGGDGGNE